MGDPVLQLDRVLQRRSPIRICPTAGLLEEPDRRRELGDSSFEERHDRWPGAWPDVQRHIEVAAKGLQVPEPAGFESGGVSAHRDRARETFTDEHPAGALEEAGWRDQVRRVVQAGVAPQRLPNGEWVEASTEQLGEFLIP